MKKKKKKSPERWKALKIRDKGKTHREQGYTSEKAYTPFLICVYIETYVEGRETTINLKMSHVLAQIEIMCFYTYKTLLDENLIIQRFEW